MVLGPGSALYGPNSADGVMHIITRSPFASQGTSVNVGMGERSLRQTGFRHAGALGDRLGYKVSAQYYTGTEWEYTDPEEDESPETEAGGHRRRSGSAASRTARLTTPGPGVPKCVWTGGRSDDLTAILAAGHSKSDVVGLTGVGASQAID